RAAGSTGWAFHSSRIGADRTRASAHSTCGHTASGVEWTYTTPRVTAASRTPRCVFPYDLEIEKLPCPMMGPGTGGTPANRRFLGPQSVYRARAEGVTGAARAGEVTARARVRFFPATAIRRPPSLARSPAVASNTSKTARASVRAGQAGAA